MGNSKKYKTPTDAEQGKNLVVAEPIVEYYAEKKFRDIKITIDPNLDKFSDAPLTAKAAKAKKMFDDYYNIH